MCPHNLNQPASTIPGAVQLRLKEAGIDAEIWTGHTLTLKVQLYPDILSKFFPWASVEHFANQWMERVAFYELVSKAFFDPRERVARWARELFAKGSGDHNEVEERRPVGAGAPGDQASHREMQDAGENNKPTPIDGTLRSVNQFGNSWHFKGPWLSLSVILPDQRFTHASAAINFNRPDVEGMTLTIDHKWLLEKFLFSEGAPLTSQHRAFVVGTIPKDLRRYVVDLPHCRLTLQDEGVKEVAAVADLLTGVMRNSLRNLEDTWCARDFPFVAWGGKKVAMAALDVEVWREIGRFSEVHDVSNGSTQWHMFDGNRNVLKPYHEHSSEEFDAGYHGVFYAVELEELSHRNEVVLLWQPNDLTPDQQFTSRGWWSCEYAYKWLSEALLPEVKRRVFERHFGRRRDRLFKSKRAGEFAAHLNERFVARDLRQVPLVRDGQWSTSVVQAVEALQHFFHLTRTPEPYVRKQDIENLYHAVAMLADGKRGYVGYVSSKLGLHESPADHAELVQLILEHIQNDRVVANCAVADNAFRAMLELLNDSDEWLSESAKQTIRTRIEPFARLRDDATLITRHSKWA